MSFKNIFFVSLLFLFSIACKNNSTTSNDPLEILNKKVEANSKDAKVYVERAWYYYKNNLINPALNDLNKAISLDPKEYKAYLLLSNVYVLEGKAQSALNALNKGLHENPDNIDILLSKADLYFIMKDNVQCLNTIDQILKLEPNTAKAYTIKGLMEMENEQMQLAIKSFQKAIDINPKEYDAILQLGYIYYNIDKQVALNYFKTANNFFPDKIEPLYSLGMIYQENDQPEKAIEAYNQILKIDSTNSNAYYNIGYVYLVLLEDFDKSISYFSDNISLDSNNIDAIYNRGYAYELNKDYTNAEADYRKILEIKTNDSLGIVGLNRLDKYK